jgi:molecular chaperone GrpE
MSSKTSEDFSGNAAKSRSKDALKATTEPPAEIPAAGEPSLSCEQVEELRAKAAKAVETFDRLVRTTADFENFKKRSARERDDARRSATEALLLKLLPVLDNFDMAMTASQQPGATVENLKAGVAMIQNQLRSALADTGLDEVNALGAAFDPALHDAISQLETSDVPEGQVVQQLRKGYKLRDRLLRPASVVVSKTPATP